MTVTQEMIVAAFIIGGLCFGCHYSGVVWARFQTRRYEKMVKAIIAKKRAHKCRDCTFYLGFDDRCESRSSNTIDGRTRIFYRRPFHDNAGGDCVGFVRKIKIKHNRSVL